jgi:hypothetical protein
VTNGRLREREVSPAARLAYGLPYRFARMTRRSDEMVTLFGVLFQ